MSRRTESDKRTTESLKIYESKINNGYARALEQKDAIRRSAYQSLTKLDEITELNKKRQETADLEKYHQFLQR